MWIMEWSIILCVGLLLLIHERALWSWLSKAGLNILFPVGLNPLWLIFIVFAYLFTQWTAEQFITRLSCFGWGIILTIVIVGLLCIGSKIMPSSPLPKYTEKASSITLAKTRLIAGQVLVVISLCCLLSPLILVGGIFMIPLLVL